MLWKLSRTIWLGASNEYPQHMFSWIIYVETLQASGQALLMSTHNICFHGEISTKSIILGWKKMPYLKVFEV